MASPHTAQAPSKPAKQPRRAASRKVVIRSPADADIPEQARPITAVIHMPLPGYLNAKMQMMQHVQGKIDSLVAMVQPEDVQRYDVQFIVQIAEERPVTP